MSKTALFAAARDWNASLVRQLLAQAPALAAARDAKGRTALHLGAGVAAGNKRDRIPASIATARALLKGGADLNAVHEIPDEGEVFPATPLWYALARGRNDRLAKFLLNEGADPNFCLWTVIWSNQPELVRLLLAAGAATEERFDGETPLIYAARLGREEAVLELVAAGADRSARDSKGFRAADHARRRRLSPAALAAVTPP